MVEGPSQFNENLIKNYNEDFDIEYFPEADVQYLEKIYNFHNELPFSPETIKMKKKGKFGANLYNKKEYAMHKKT